MKNKSGPKSGPLFHFDVRDDVRLVSDASVEKEESHAGKAHEILLKKEPSYCPAACWTLFYVH